MGFLDRLKRKKKTPEQTRPSYTPRSRKQKKAKRLELKKLDFLTQVGDCPFCKLPCFSFKKQGFFFGSGEVYGEYLFAKAYKCPRCGAFLCGECAFEAGKRAGRRENICPSCSSSL